MKTKRQNPNPCNARTFKVPALARDDANLLERGAQVRDTFRAVRLLELLGDGDVEVGVDVDKDRLLEVEETSLTRVRRTREQRNAKLFLENRNIVGQHGLRVVGVEADGAPS